MSAGRATFVAVAQGVAAASAGTAKTVLNVISASNKSLKLTEASIGFIGASGSAKPVLVELCKSSQGGAGTSTSVTPTSTDQEQQTTTDATAAKAYSAEPTTLTVLRTWRPYPQSDKTIQLPLGRELKAYNGGGLCLRVTFESAETTTNIDAYLEYEE